MTTEAIADWIMRHRMFFSFTITFLFVLALHFS